MANGNTPIFGSKNDKPVSDEKPVAASKPSPGGGFGGDKPASSSDLGMAKNDSEALAARDKAEQAGDTANTKALASKPVIESTDEVLKESKTEADIALWREHEYKYPIDPVKADNAVLATVVGSAGYSANPPSEVKSETLDEPDLKGVDGAAIERAMRAQRTVEDEQKRKDQADGKTSGKMTSVKLIKAYRPATKSNFKINGSDQVGPDGAGGKISAGISVDLPEAEALRAVKLGIAEMPAKR